MSRDEQMDSQKNLLHLLGDWWAARQARRPATAPRASDWLPSRGNIIFTLLMIALLVVAQNVGAPPLPARGIWEGD